METSVPNSRPPSNWVNEKTELKPTTKNGKARLYAEKEWINLFKKNKIPVQIFRLSGIYSKDNNVLNRLKNETLKIELLSSAFSLLLYFIFWMCFFNTHQMIMCNMINIYILILY